MPRYNSDISVLLYEEEVSAMFARARSPKEAYLVSILWTTGARPSEILELKKDSFYFDRSTLRITLTTKKLGDSKEFMIRERTLEFERLENIEANPYIEQIVNFVNAAPNDGFILPYTTRWCEKVINRLGMEALNKMISPYHFRHSVLSHLASKGFGVTELKEFKGAKSIQSVEPYLHAKPFVIRAKHLEREK